MTALRTLLAGIVDYAGLFPPAALDMPTAVRNYAQYRASDDVWMLGRFVVPAERLGELARALAAIAPDEATWQVSALLGADPSADMTRIAEFEQAHGARVTIDSLEVKAGDADAVRRIGALVRGGRDVFVEIPLANDPRALLASIAAAGLHAKARTGGVTADAFPAASAIARFMQACVDAGVSFKATAGLHHPIRATYRLTYAPDAPVGTMFGFLNVFLAAAAVAQGAPESDVVALLTETRPDALIVTEHAITWRALRFDTVALRAVRERVALSFGSCSFREPVDDLRALALLTVA
ncbi:MAG TPA: hypothetical protein VHB25_16905 [Gemmatimonadaceae bacterium]|nr:hypothetical protein [Gemmatimonadaceae bacterium]